MRPQTQAGADGVALDKRLASTGGEMDVNTQSVRCCASQGLTSSIIPTILKRKNQPAPSSRPGFPLNRPPPVSGAERIQARGKIN
jgi:hypothetical protein